MLRRFWRYLRQLPIGSGMVAVIGFAFLALGAIVSWRADAATPLVIAGVVLTVVALAPWQALEGSAGDYKLRVEKATMALDLVSERPDLPDDAKQEIRQAADQLEALHEAAMPGETSWLTLGRRAARWLTSTPTASSTVGEESVNLLLIGAPDDTGTGVNCTVMSPHSGFHVAEAKPVAEARTWISAFRGFRVVYPHDFGEDARFERGVYRAMWTAGNQAIAIDEFEIAKPDAQPSGTPTSTPPSATLPDSASAADAPSSN